jgi:hypothetical protein
MGALPKNKITSVERGKRRRGNKPTITRDVKISSVPKHKAGLVAQIKKAVGIETRSAQSTKKPKAK